MRLYICLVCLLFSFSKNASAAVILQYHHVSETTPSSTSISPTLFEQHLDYLVQNKFEVVSLNKIIQTIKKGLPVSDNWVAITFDDGYKNVLTNAHEKLVARGFAYTIFVNPGLIDIRASGHLSWEQLNSMAKDNVEISNHSWDHLHMVRQLENESPTQWKERLKQNILMAEARIKEMTGQNNQVLVYPYGEFNSEIQKLLTELDFIGVGQHSGAVDEFTNLTRIPRFPANGIYAKLETLKTKLKTKAFEIVNYPDQPMITMDSNPEIIIGLNVKDFNLNQLVCYCGGEVMTPKWLSENKFKIKATQKLKPGRNKYICTARSIKQPEFYYWFSQPWMILNPDGSWYEEG
ncbi:polysaccharide deacetylase family protein [Marinicellulosiphila megalodicopiae]|uniref:polysaccharide deacetylase family protein n=1 Tax=Marinicellulosiphila megalodicopiae TaxID=2724896 RepID=UPI003BAEA60B